MTDERPTLISVIGPTATGKTRLAVALARKADGEIISADSRQVYRGMDIGTGKDIEEYGQGTEFVPYHMIDVAEPGDEFNLYEFQRGFVESFEDIVDRGKLPVMCGGTGLYIDSVLRRYRLADVPADPDLRAALELMTDEDLAVRLALSKKPHNTTDTADRDRLVRAIEIAEYGEDVDSIVPQFNSHVFGMRIDRRKLRERIAARLKHRMKNGLVEEVEGLLQVCSPEQLDYYGLEYRLVTAYVLHRINRNDMFQKLQSEIVQFAKRQEKWFRKMEREGVNVNWLDPNDAVSDMVDLILETSC